MDKWVNVFFTAILCDYGNFHRKKQRLRLCAGSWGKETVWPGRCIWGRANVGLPQWLTDFYVARYSLFCRTLGQQGVTTGEKGLLKCHIAIMIIVLIIIIDRRHRAWNQNWRAVRNHNTRCSHLWITCYNSGMKLHYTYRPSSPTPHPYNDVRYVPRRSCSIFNDPGQRVC